MKLTPTYIFLLLWSCSLYAAPVDSLKQLLNQTTQATDQAILYNKIVREYNRQYHDSTSYFAQKALNLAKKQNNIQTLLTAHLQLADVLRQQGDDTNAANHVAQVEEQLKQRNYPLVKVHLLLTKGLLAYSQYQDEEALVLFKEGAQLNQKYQAGFCVDFCINLAKITPPSEAEAHIKEGFNCSVDILGRIILQKQLANLYKEQKRYKEALKFYTSNKQLAQNIKDTLAESNAYQNIGGVYLLEGDWKKAIDFYLKSANLKEKTGDQKGVAHLYHNIARVYFNQKRYETSLAYYQKCENYYSNNKDTAELVEIWSNKASVYIAQEKYNTATELLNQVLPLLEQFPNPTVALKAQMNLGNIHFKKENYSKALELFKTSFQTAQQQGDDFNLVMINNFLGEVYFALQEAKQSIFYYQEALDLSKEFGLLYEQGIALYGLYETHKYAGNTTQALNWYEQYTTVKDSLFNTETTNVLAAMQASFDAKEKQDSIRVLHAENEKVVLENKLKTNQIYLLLLGMGLILGTGALLWLRRHQQQQALLHEQKVKEMLHEQERKVWKATVDAQLQERARLGKEVHDSLGSLLATLQCQYIGGKQLLDKPEPFRESYMAMGGLIKQAADETYRIAHEMDTGEQFAFELKPALDALMQHIRATRQFELSFDYIGKTFKLPRKLALTLYQVTLEALTNILKHAQAKNVMVRVFQKSFSVILTVEDDGRGFDTKTYQAGIGLRSMQERVSSLGGNINIESTPRSGTTITATVPISSGIDI